MPRILPVGRIMLTAVWMVPSPPPTITSSASESMALRISDAQSAGSTAVSDTSAPCRSKALRIAATVSSIGCPASVPADRLRMMAVLRPSPS